MQDYHICWTSNFKAFTRPIPHLDWLYRTQILSDLHIWTYRTQWKKTEIDKMLQLNGMYPIQVSMGMANCIRLKEGQLAMVLQKILRDKRRGYRWSEFDTSKKRELLTHQMSVHISCARLHIRIMGSKYQRLQKGKTPFISHHVLERELCTFSLIMKLRIALSRVWDNILLTVKRAVFALALTWYGNLFEVQSGALSAYSKRQSLVSRTTILLKSKSAPWMHSLTTFGLLLWYSRITGFMGTWLRRFLYNCIVQAWTLTKLLVELHRCQCPILKYQTYLEALPFRFFEAPSLLFYNVL